MGGGKGRSYDCSCALTGPMGDAGMLTAGGEGAADSLRERSSGKQVSVRLRLQLGVVGKAGVPPEGVGGVGVQETRRPPHCLDTHRHKKLQPCPRLEQQITFVQGPAQVQDLYPQSDKYDR